jgi:hypothetical protein
LNTIQRPLRRVEVYFEALANIYSGIALQDVILRALEDNPELEADLPTAQVKRLKAEAAKERGNDAFKAKDYTVALQHYCEAIKLDNTNSTYYSNRCSPPLFFAPQQPQPITLLSGMHMHCYHVHCSLSVAL